MSIKARRNIPLDYSFTFLSNINLLHALWMIWLSINGFSLLELGILEGIFHLTSFLMEVPTGAVADLWGRKQSRVMGRIVFFISIFFLWISRSFGMQAIGFILTAIAYNLESGAGEALVYDSMVLIKKENDYIKVKGRKELIFQLAFIISYLSGGYLAVINYNLVFMVTLIATAAAILNALAMSEPPVERKKETTQSNNLIVKIGRSIFEQTKDSIFVIKNRPRISFLIVFSETIWVFTTTIYFYLQTWWKFEGYSEWYMGIVFAIQCAVSGLSSVIAPQVDARIGERRILLILPIMLLLYLWAIAFSPFKSVLFILTGAIGGILEVAISAYINKMIPSENRATILSFQSMTFSFLMILIFPVMGWIGDLYSLEMSFIIMAIVATVLFAVYIFYSSPQITVDRKNTNSPDLHEETP